MTTYRLCSICGEFQPHEAKMYNDPQTRALICARCFEPMLPPNDPPAAPDDQQEPHYTEEDLKMAEKMHNEWLNEHIVQD